MRRGDATWYDFMSDRSDRLRLAKASDTVIVEKKFSLGLSVS